jgi:hypothetical protein
MTREQIMKNALQFKVGIIRVLSPYVQMLLVCILYVKSKDILRKRKKTAVSQPYTAQSMLQTNGRPSQRENAESRFD